MEYEKPKEQWLLEENAAFKGWDFSHLNGRTSEEKLKWDYLQIVRNYLKPDSILLDMGTGGGEFLLGLGHPHHQTHITEGYLPNFELCLKKPAPLGIGVARVYDDEKLP